jgi:hypothetical protein
LLSLVVRRRVPSRGRRLGRWLADRWGFAFRTVVAGPARIIFRIGISQPAADGSRSRRGAETCGSCLSPVALNADARKAEWPRREQPVCPARLHLPKGRRHTAER